MHKKDKVKKMGIKIVATCDECGADINAEEVIGINASIYWGVYVKGFRKFKIAKKEVGQTDFRYAICPSCAGTSTTRS